MGKIIVILIFFFYTQGFSQLKIDTNSLVYNLSIGASNPAFGILGLSPSSIERPKDPNDFSLLLQNATENFSIIPKNYSIEISSWVYNDKVSYSSFNSSNLGKSISQSFTLSFATSTTESTDSTMEITRLGTGLKFSIIRGNISNAFTKMSKEYETQLNKLAVLNEDNLRKNRNNDEEYLKLTQQRDALLKSIELINTSITALNLVLKKLSNLPDSKEVKDEIELTRREIESKDKELISMAPQVFSIEDKIKKRIAIIDPITNKQLDKDRDRLEIIKKLEEEAKKVQFIRNGFKLDFAAAAAFEFNEQISLMTRLGYWFTGGWDWINANPSNSSSLLGLLKISYEKDSSKNWKNLYNITHSTCDYDMGLRFIRTWSNFSFSIEAVSRNAFNNDTQAKYLINLGYNTGDNNLIIFSLGKDFDNKAYKTGNFIAALNLLLGLGATRPFQ